MLNFVLVGFLYQWTRLLISETPDTGASRFSQDERSNDIFAVVTVPVIVYPIEGDVNMRYLV
jgi:hypothetical protein